MKPSFYYSGCFINVSLKLHVICMYIDDLLEVKIINQITDKYFLSVLLLIFYEVNEPKYIIICNKFCACIYHVFILRNVHIAKSKRKPKIKYLFGKLFMHPNSSILFFQLCIVIKRISHNIHIKTEIQRAN